MCDVLHRVTAYVMVFAKDGGVVYRLGWKLKEENACPCAGVGCRFFCPKSGSVPKSPG